MGEENRGSSGSGMVLIVVGILAVVLLVPCCGIVALFGAGFFMARNAAQEAQTEFRLRDAQQAIEKEVQKANEEALKSNQDFQKAIEGLNKELEPLKIPDDAPTPPPGLTPPPPPGSEDEKK